MVNARIVICAGLLAGLFWACEPTRRTLVIPDEMRAKKPPPAKKGKGTVESPRVVEPLTPQHPGTYTVRLAESGRLWEVDLPQSSGGYQVRVPLAGGTPGGIPEMATEADQQIYAPASGADGGTVVTADGKLVDPRTGYAQKSYLGSLAKVNELYRAKRFELALVELVNLEQQFPEDARILAMKGSLLVRLRKIPQAREAYERALAINPEDIGLAEALREISEGE